MTRLFVVAAAIAVISAAAWAQSNTCVNGGAAPASPPSPVPEFHVGCRNINPDGGYICFIAAPVPGSNAQVTPYPLGPVITGGLVTAAGRAAAIDNAWGDGGVP